MSSRRSRGGTLPRGKQELFDFDDKAYNGVLSKNGYIVVVISMVSKDQAIGWLIFLVCVVVGIAYVGCFAVHEALRPWLIAVPVILAFLLVLGIGAWIGWTMATTPPPKPIEEIEAEEKKEEEKVEEKIEEKVEEEKAE